MAGVFLGSLGSVRTGASAAEPAAATRPAGDDEDASADGREVVVTGRAPGEQPALEGRATDRVTRLDLDMRQPRSAPDALRYTPGVYVQQTAHGQGSAYIRGVTGRRTLLLFDGLRINHALFRQGPNQYFFTVDARTIDSVEVIRGSASVELGSNAVGGAVLVHPLEPRIEPTRDGLHLQPKAALRHATADDELGGRLQVDVQLGPRTGLLAGVGYRDVDQLEAAGPIEGLKTPEEVGRPAIEKEVPRFEEDGRTQMGTGFRELTADARLVHWLTPDDKLTAAAYVFRQYDSPRTDQCPPPEAPDSECLIYDEQFRTHAYGRAELRPGWAALEAADVALSFQRQHERRRNDREVFENLGRDDIDVWEIRARATTAPLPVLGAVALRVPFGADGSYETVSSAAWTRLVRTNITRELPRGQYVEGARYRQGGAWIAPRLLLGDRLVVRGGARIAFADVDSPAVPDADTRAVDESWRAVVLGGGVEWRPFVPLTLMVNVEQGFRPPNLDDLIGRQLTGQGYQVGNDALEPEESVTAEVGARWATRALTLEGWVFQTWLIGPMERRDAECPQGDLACRASRRAPPVHLVNLDTAEIRGAEAQARIRPGRGLEARATVSYAWGEGAPLPNEDERRPLTRIPPLNGTAELRWLGPGGLYLGAGLRWATAQDRLSMPGDHIDHRIPFGGTPGYVVYDARAGLLREALAVHVVLENLSDEAYRVHGSSVNGAGRGLMINVEVSP